VSISKVHWIYVTISDTRNPKMTARGRRGAMIGIRGRYSPGGGAAAVLGETEVLSDVVRCLGLVQQLKFVSQMI
jgi:hypothetical protein